MPFNNLPRKKIVLALGDIFVCAAALITALFARHGGAPDRVIIELYTIAAPFLILLWLTGFFVFGLYDIRSAKNEPRFFERLAKALFFDLIVTVLLFYFIPEFRLKPLVALLFIFAALGTFVFCWRAVFNAALARRTKERVLFFGISDEVMELTRFLGNHPQLGFTIAAFLKGGNGNAAGNYSDLGAPLFDSGTNLPKIVREYRISRIVVTHEIKSTQALAQALFSVVPTGITITDLPRFYESVRGKVPISLINEAWFIENLIGTRRPKYDFLKRVTDLLLVCVFGLITVTLFPIAALGIVFSTPKDILRFKEKRAREGDGIIFFRQKRVGKSGKDFDFLKLRGQILGAERFGGGKFLDRDPRAYPFGNFLRKTYLDELPQLWNVLRGDMSFVGPRPERPEFVSELEKQIPFYRMRELVLPGITGWAQINMENDASVEDAPEKIQYDLYYIKNRSIFLDIAILLKTALKLLQRSGR